MSSSRLSPRVRLWGALSVVVTLLAVAVLWLFWPGRGGEPAAVKVDETPAAITVLGAPTLLESGGLTWLLSPRSSENTVGPPGLAPESQNAVSSAATLSSRGGLVLVLSAFGGVALLSLSLGFQRRVVRLCRGYCAPHPRSLAGR